MYCTTVGEPKRYATVPIRSDLKMNVFGSSNSPMFIYNGGEKTV
jgi:hypothetical protein